MASIWQEVSLSFHDTTSCDCPWHVYDVGHGACHSCLWTTIWLPLSRQELYALVSASLSCKRIPSNLISKGAGPLRIPGEVLELNEFQLWFAPTTIGVSLFILIGHALAERRFKYTDLDPDEDQKIRLQASIFLFLWVHHELQEDIGRLGVCSLLISVQRLKRCTPFHPVRAQEFITFIYKNFGSLLNFCASACLVAQVLIAVGVNRIYTNRLLRGH